jgi:exodeoxyribonuclease VII large subunit
MHERALHHAAQRTDRAALRLHALRPQARLDLLRRRQDDALRRLHAAWRQLDQQRHARLRHADAVLRAARPQRRLAQLRERLHALAPRPQAATVRQMQRHALHLQGLARSLEAVSPLATVARGYTLLLREDGRVVRGVGDVRPGDRLEARLRDGTLPLRVESDD